MFESDFFEFFSHIHPWQPPVIYLPIIAYAILRAFVQGTGVLPFIGLFLVGIVQWTLMEYWLHRLLFHYVPTSRLGKRLIWLLHGVHHDWPNDKLRLVFPPTISLPIAVFHWWLAGVLFGDLYRYSAFAGLASGYLSYDMIHYYVHHFAPKNRIGKFLRKYHLAHHFKDPEHGFGVSNPTWDYVFGTKPKSS